MKKFKFTLQTVHSVRETRQEKESLTLAELRAEAGQAAARVASIEKIRLQTIEDYTLRLHSGEQLNAMEMELNSNHFASLNNLQKEAEKVLQEKKQACLRQVEIVTAAMREVKVTDQLRETQKERHQLEFARLEQNNVDELVSTNFARRAQK
jgi:flagellar export protein FliJ